MKNVLVGITGYKGAGKDIVAAAFINNGFTNIKFADALKNMLRVLLNMRGVNPKDRERMIEGDLKEIPTPYLEGKTPREAMQWLGTEWGRDLIGQDIWVNTFKDQVANADNVVCTDLRFPNEEGAIRDMGGYVVKVVRPSKTKNEFSLHESERYIDEIVYDYLIKNESTIPMLESLAGGVFEQIEQKENDFAEFVDGMKK